MVRPPRTLPESLSATMKMELDRLDDTGVSIKVDEPTDWINKMSVVKKIAGDVRICIDLRPLNLALKREHFKPWMIFCPGWETRQDSQYV